VNPMTIFLKIFGWHEILADFRKNICFLEKFRENDCSHKKCANFCFSEHFREICSGANTRDRMKKIPVFANILIIFEKIS
jgi:hypothetical protein